MDILTRYKILSEHFIKLVESTTVIAVTENEPITPYIHMKENSYILTDEVRNYGRVVTAHVLDQYKTQFTTIRLRDKSDCWLNALIEKDLERRKELYENSGHD